MSRDVIAALAMLEGQEVTVRFANAGVTGRLIGIQKESWGYVLHLSNAIGDHFIPFPGETLHIVAPKS